MGLSVHAFVCFIIIPMYVLFYIEINYYCYCCFCDYFVLLSHPNDRSDHSNRTISFYVYPNLDDLLWALDSQYSMINQYLAINKNSNKKRVILKIAFLLDSLWFLILGIKAQLFFLNPFWVLIRVACRDVRPQLKFRVFFLGTYFISIFVLLFVVSIRFFIISYFFNYFDSLLWLFTKGFYHVKLIITSDLLG